ncbi:Crp/Fnr family transcriptional regulator [Pollutibacter soli]|uniref:Crp/Fnr family transcriptional regulator n=1 Tax=Pollutibacter soli TaxID=3034157 RepID=UPI003013E586
MVYLVTVQFLNLNTIFLNPLFSYFLASGVPASDIETITNAFSFTKITKGNFFAEEGKTSKYLAFITKGFFQYYYLKDGKELTTYVTGENTFLASVASFYRQQPCKEYVRALIDSELWQIHYTDLAKLKVENEAFKSFYINAVEQVMVGIDESRSNLLIMTAEERYERLLKEEPGLLQQIPLQYLASILGVTPRHLSRIRNNI